MCSTSKHIDVQNYYEKLQSNEELLTSACTTCTKPSSNMVLEALNQIHPEVQKKFYGCGLVFPELLEGKTVLDLGSGSGRDCFILSKLVKENGSVIGIDMTESQINLANQYIEYHREKWGYTKSNVKFLKGYIENLEAIENESIDLIVSNCVINLSPDKYKVLSECYRVLKKGGEMYFSDVYSDRRLPKECMEDKILWGECLSGALYYNDFITIAKSVGFLDPRLYSSNDISLSDEIKQKTGPIKFYSATYRLFKIDGLEPYCEDYGQSVIYKGTIPENPSNFKLDEHHIMNKGEEFRVCGNTYKMLHETRYKDHFEFKGDMNVHYGIFKGCGDKNPFNSSKKGCC